MLLGSTYSSNRGKPTFNKGILKSALTRLQSLQKKEVEKRIVGVRKNSCFSMSDSLLYVLYKPLENCCLLHVYVHLGQVYSFLVTQLHNTITPIRHDFHSLYEDVDNIVGI